MITGTKDNNTVGLTSESWDSTLACSL